MKIRPVGA